MIRRSCAARRLNRLANRKASFFSKQSLATLLARWLPRFSPSLSQPSPKRKARWTSPGLRRSWEGSKHAFPTPSPRCLRRREWCIQGHSRLPSARTDSGRRDSLDSSGRSREGLCYRRRRRASNEASATSRILSVARPGTSQGHPPRFRCGPVTNRHELVFLSGSPIAK